MEPVRDLNHFSTLVREARSAGERIVTNCYLLPNEIKADIEANRLFWKADDFGVLFFREEAAFYQLFFYVSLPELSGFAALDKPVVLDFVYVESSRPSPVAEQVSRWKDCGFEDYKTYHRLLATDQSAENVLGASAPAEDPAYQTIEARPGDIESIRKLWMDTLDPYSVAIPSHEFLVGLIGRKQLYCVVDREDRVVAAGRVHNAGNVCTLFNFAVDPAHRRRGLSHRLFRYPFEQGREAGIRKYYAWVADDNGPSRKMCHGEGYAIDGKVTIQLLFAKTRKETE